MLENSVVSLISFALTSAFLIFFKWQYVLNYKLHMFHNLDLFSLHLNNYLVHYILTELYLIYCIG